MPPGRCFRVCPIETAARDPRSVSGAGGNGPRPAFDHPRSARPLPPSVCNPGPRRRSYNAGAPSARPPSARAAIYIHQCPPELPPPAICPGIPPPVRPALPGCRPSCRRSRKDPPGGAYKTRGGPGVPPRVAQKTKTPLPFAPRTPRYTAFQKNPKN